MVLADSHGISRAPCYSGYFHGTAERIAATGLAPPVVRPSNLFAYAPAPRSGGPAEPPREVPQPRPCNARRLSRMDRFSPFRFRSPLLTESLLFSLPAGTEMFHFPAFPPGSLCVQLPVMRHDAARGFPIRKSWPQRPVIDSTRLIADSHVLHRLPMPRHPPCALVNLTTNRSSKSTSTNRENHKEPHPRAWIQGLPSKKLLCTAPHTRPDQTADTRLRHPYKMLASTMQFPNNNPVAPATRAPGPKSGTARPRPCAGQPKQRPQRTPRTCVRGLPVSCCLRTQQCAKDPGRHRHRFFPARKRAYSNRKRQAFRATIR